MNEIQCTNCGTRFEPDGTDFCPSAGCGFPVEFMGHGREVDEEPAQEEILRRPEDATDPDTEAIDSDSETIEPPPEPVVSPPADTTGDDPTTVVPEAEELQDADDTTGITPPVFGEREERPRFPVPVLAAGVAALVVVGLGLFLLLRAGEEDVVVAGLDASEEEESVEGDPAPPSGEGETRDPPEERQPSNGNDDDGERNDGQRGDAADAGNDRGDDGDDGDDGNDGNDNGDPDPPLIEVPDVLGRTVEEAEAELTAQDLVVEIVRIETDETEPGRVVAQDPGAGQRVERHSPIELGVADQPPPDVNLTVELDSCSLVLGGAPSGADSLVVSLHTLNLGAEEVTRAVLTRVTADGGLTTDAIGRLSGPNSTIDPGLELGPDDYRGPLDATVTIDPDDDIPESTRDNNTLHIRVDLPDARPEANMIPLPCG